MIKSILVLFTLLTISPILAEGSGQGELALEFRQFSNDDNVTTEDSALSVFSRLENRYDAENWQYVFRGFARVDKEDQDRSMMAIEDAYLRYFLDENQIFGLSAGYKIFNWSTIEAFHPADSVNSRNFDTNLENLDKLGEPVVEFETTTDNFKWSLFFFPRFERPFYPGDQSRLGLGADLDKPVVMEGTELEREQWINQFGTRFSFTFMDFDTSFHILDHINRNFVILGTHEYTYLSLLDTYVPNDLAKFTGAPVPYYFRSREYGMSTQGIVGPLLLKIEAVYRNFEESQAILTAIGLRQIVDHGEVAIGLEYSFTHDYGGETFLFTEFNTILDTDESTRAELSIFQRDIFLAARHSLNDIEGTEFTIGFFTDLERDNEYLYTLSAARRLTNQWKLSGGFRIFDAKVKGTAPVGLELYNEDNHAFFTLTRYF